MDRPGLRREAPLRVAEELAPRPAVAVRLAAPAPREALSPVPRVEDWTARFETPSAARVPYDPAFPAESGDEVGVRAAVVAPRRMPDPREEGAGLVARTVVVAPRTMPVERAEEAETGLAIPVAPPRAGIVRAPASEDVARTAVVAPRRIPDELGAVARTAAPDRAGKAVVVGIAAARAARAA